MNSPKLDYNTLEISNYIASNSSTKFLGMIIDEKLTWYDQINQLLKRLSSACFALRISTPLLPDETLREIYFAYVHSILTYGIIFWGNSTHAIKILRMQKKIIRIMTKSNNRSSCRQLFKTLRILPLQSQYILSLLSFVVQNKDQFTNNLEIHNINTRYNMNLHPPLLNLTLSQKGAHNSGIRLFNHLPVRIKQLAGDINLFKWALKNLLRSHSFYSIQEYLQTKLIWMTNYLLMGTTHIAPAMH